MSAIDTDTLKSASDLNIIFDTRPEVIALLQIRHDSLLEFGRLIKTTKIVNEDGLNNITYRTKSPSAPLRTVPPNSDETIEGFDFGTNTGQALAILGSGASFGQDTGDFELQKAIEAAKAQASLGGFVGGGLFANPDFPITLGEAFLGKSGTIVSQSISNLTPSQLQEFLEKFGSA